jgi:hypothetical protein
MNWFRTFRRWLTRLMLRAGLLPSSTKADTDTMGEYKALMVDDPKPRLVLPPPGPYSDLIRRVRLYAQNGAKALSPLLDRPLLDGDGALDREAIDSALIACSSVALPGSEAEGILDALDLKGDNPEWDWAAIRAIHAAYNSPWTVVDGEVYEYEREGRKAEVLQ